MRMASGVCIVEKRWKLPNIFKFISCNETGKRKTIENSQQSTKHEGDAFPVDA